MSHPYRVQGYVCVPEAQVDRFKAALVEHMALTRAEPGCLYFEVTQRADAPTHFDVHEAFVDQDAFLAHQVRAASTPWMSLTQDVTRHYTMPDDAPTD